ncbi:Integrase, catalytic core protein [Phytophthora megakarya]|uniref:Integrase, catalytic core protein n=1 Tax=Phytophthora megakarya TaxID=4795 RepID=A0A225WP74_9STRA|nr:Integrase, catalytic core protein [Phytophthora megakarya]
MQIYGVDYLEVHSPVVRLETLRVLSTLAAVWNYETHQMDVTIAFLNGKIDVEVFMKQAEGFEVQGKEDWVCHLLKSLYGLKQAHRIWFQLLKSFLLELGFTMLKSEGCVAVKVIDNQLVFIPLYVDDMILFAPTMQLIKDMKSCKTPGTPDLKLTKAMCAMDADESVVKCLENGVMECSERCGSPMWQLAGNAGRE